MKYKKFRKILISASIFCFVFANASCFAHATDPVSAATMANALAQAITAYGASQGVSMTFDVTSTDGIGEGIHDLWDQFKEDVNDNNIPTYDSFAVTVWSTLYSKVNNHVAINLSNTSVSYLDAFWNWLLSGPAEMTKVDNQYYEWAIDQNTNTVVPISVFSYTNFTLNGNPLNTLPIICYYGNNSLTLSSSQSVYAIVYQESDPTWYDAICITLDNTEFYQTRTWSDNHTVTGHSQSPSSSNGGWYVSKIAFDHYYVPSGVTLSTYISGGSTVDYTGQYSDIGINLVSNSTDINVQPYIGDTVPQDVYIPDNDDVNYAPLPYIGELDIPWSDSLYGDGTGTLTDAQSEAITGDLSDVIAQDTTLTIADSQDDVIANEVYIPFLPVTLPSFNFSFSGIWHYVVTWVSSLGAWFTTLFTIWSCLPYAMVVPVYATLVVVIVLGVYRRFLA